MSQTRADLLESLIDRCEIAKLHSNGLGVKVLAEAMKDLLGALLLDEKAMKELTAQSRCTE